RRRLGGRWRRRALSRTPAHSTTRAEKRISRVSPEKRVCEFLCSTGGRAVGGGARSGWQPAGPGRGGGQRGLVGSPPARGARSAGGAGQPRKAWSDRVAPLMLVNSRSRSCTVSADLVAASAS